MTLVPVDSTTCSIQYCQASEWKIHLGDQEMVAMCFSSREHGEPGHCFITVSGRHLQLNPLHLKMWAVAMVQLSLIKYILSLNIFCRHLETSQSMICHAQRPLMVHVMDRSLPSKHVAAQVQVWHRQSLLQPTTT